MTRPSLPLKTNPLFTNRVMTDDGDVYISDEIVNALGYTGLQIRVMADTEVATATLDVKVQAYMAVEGVWQDIAGASLVQITANQTTPIDLVIDPRATAVANRVVSQPVPARSRVHVTCGDASGDGFTVSAEYTLYP